LLSKLLEKNNIYNELVQNKSTLDSSFSSVLLEDFEIKIDKKDFANAEGVILKDSENLIKELPSDYYLFSFENEELIDIIEKKDEWSEMDYTLSIQLLKSRGIYLSIEDLDKSAKKRISELSKPEKNQQIWIIVGYVFAFLGGFLGFIIGYFLWKQKKTLPNGERIFEYDKEDREHGRKILILSILAVFFYIIIFMLG
jgi:hypothetical protein